MLSVVSSRSGKVKQEIPFKTPQAGSPFFPYSFRNQWNKRMTPRTGPAFENNDTWHILNNDLYDFPSVPVSSLSQTHTSKYCRKKKMSSTIKTASGKRRPYYLFSGPKNIMYSRNQTLERRKRFWLIPKPVISSERDYYIRQDLAISKASQMTLFPSLVEESRPHIWVSKLYHSEKAQIKKCLKKSRLQLTIIAGLFSYSFLETKRRKTSPG